MSENKIDWTHFCLAIAAIFVGFTLAAWGVVAANHLQLIIAPASP